MKILCLKRPITLLPCRYTGDHVAEKLQKIVEMKIDFLGDDKPLLCRFFVQIQEETVEHGKIADDVLYLRSLNRQIGRASSTVVQS